MSETAARYDDLDTSMIGFVGVVGCILTFVIIITASAVYHQFEQKEEDYKITNLPRAQAENILAEQRGRLANYSWVDKEKQIVSIPIEQAMKLVLADLSGKKVASAAPTGSEQ